MSKHSASFSILHFGLVTSVKISYFLHRAKEERGLSVAVLPRVTAPSPNIPRPTLSQAPSSAPAAPWGWRHHGLCPLSSSLSPHMALCTALSSAAVHFCLLHHISIHVPAFYFTPPTFSPTCAIPDAFSKERFCSCLICTSKYLLVWSA